MNKWRYLLPSLVTSVRCVLGLPVYILLLNHEVETVFVLISVAIITDVLDGWLARHLDVCTTAGAYFDAVADLLVICAGFAALAAHAVFPWWLLTVFLLMFGQFILTSQVNRVIYDPIGKYYGALLYSVLVAVLLLPDLMLSYALFILILCLTLVSVLQRWVILLPFKPYRKEK